MGWEARNYTDKTLKRLFGLSGNQCAFPGCDKELVNRNNAKESNICHIEAANEGGERYRKNMTDKERADYDNLILLCVQHHEDTDDVAEYTVKILKDMKLKHESQHLSQQLRNRPSMLINTINAIAEIDFEDILKVDSLLAFDPNHKISYNSLQKNALLIQEYKIFHGKINSLYDELELQGSIKKDKLLATIKGIYIHEKGKYVLNSENTHEIIQQNSDKIFDSVYAQLFSKVEASEAWDEDIFLGLRLIMVDAFLRCKILEEPPRK